MKPEKLKELQPSEYPAQDMFTSDQLRLMKEAVKHAYLRAFDHTSGRVVTVVKEVGILFLPSGDRFAPYFVDFRREVCVTVPYDRYLAASEVERHLMEKFVRDEFDDVLCKYNSETWNPIIYSTTFVPNVRVKP